MKEKNPKVLMIADKIKIEGLTSDEIAELIAVPTDVNMGDYCLPCFRFAKTLRKSPVEIAKSLAESITLSDGIAKVEAVNGYLNFTLDKVELAKEILDKVLKEGKKYGASNIGEGKTVCIDYSSINIAKPFHMGHLSTTVIGGALYKVHKKLGYKVVGINHLGDWGTQFGKLIVAFKKWGNEKTLRKKGMPYLNSLYVKYHENAEKDPMLDYEARMWFKKIEDGNQEAIKLWSMFKDITLDAVKDVYKRLKINFDSYNGEAFYNDKMGVVIDELTEKGLLKESDGAKIVDLKDYNMAPCLVAKADGATLYATRDLAAAYYRKKRYDFDKCLYVVAYQQDLHFKQVFKVLELLGKDWYKDMIHVRFGMVSMEGGEAMSTRKGKVILLESVINKAVSRSLKVIKEKNPNLKDAEDIAEKVGVGAVIFSSLYNSRIKDIVFSYDKILNFDGETGPYVQYTNARCNSVLKKGYETWKNIANGNYVPKDEDYKGVDNKEGREVIRLIAKYPEVLKDVIKDYEPCVLTRYIMDLAQAYNKFYFEHKIITAAEGEKQTRLMLTMAVHRVLEDGLALLGIACPKKM